MVIHRAQLGFFGVLEEAAITESNKARRVMELTKRTIKTIKRNGTIDRGRIRAEIVTLRLQDEGHHTTRHVLPGKKQGWDVKKGGSGKVIRHFDTKPEAVTFARQIARNQAVELVIHKRDGTLQQIDNYGT